MGKNTNTLKCREVEYGCSVRIRKFISKDNDRLKFEVLVIPSGFHVTEDDLSKFSRFLRVASANASNSIVADHTGHDCSGQIEFKF